MIRYGRLNYTQLNIILVTFDKTFETIVTRVLENAGENIIFVRLETRNTFGNHVFTITFVECFLYKT